LDAHLNLSIARDGNDITVGEGSLYPHRVGQPDTHRAEPPRVDPTTRLIKRIELRSPHLVLTNIRADKGVSTGHLPKFLYHKLRLDNSLVMLEREATLRTP